MTLGASAVARRPLAAIALLLALGAASCSSSASLRFRCDTPINGGLLLTVDVVRATEDQARQIQSLGEKWFYDAMRESLRERVTTVTFPIRDSGGECVRELKIPVSKKDVYLVLVADYRFQSPDVSKQIVSLPRSRWKGDTVRVAVHDRELTVETR
jgi:predicted component of type VI protein secretion system